MSEKKATELFRTGYRAGFAAGVRGSSTVAVASLVFSIAVILLTEQSITGVMS